MLLPCEEMGVEEVACCIRDRFGLARHLPVDIEAQGPMHALGDGSTVHVRGLPTARLQARPPSPPAVTGPAEKSTELAAERALCAWMRTSLATSKMMFVFGILPIALDEHLKLTIAVSISIALTVAALTALFAGWHRHGQLVHHGVALARRIDIRPALGSVGLYVIICCLCVVLKS
ncbi:unnamed protein product [Symbiodinium microadriaticum]|nr:unnamed protein product [Symbiodinium microadriaticum]